MMPKLALLTLVGSVLMVGSGLADDGKPITQEASKAPIKKSSPPLPPTFSITPENETEALAFVQEHHPELAKVLEALKPMDSVEFRKAIVELLQVSRTLGDIKTRNPKRYEMALDVWKTKSRVELIAAQLSGSPSEELRSQLRTAIEAKVDAEIRRQKFELDQAEAAAKKARETLDRLETNRQAIVDARFRALAPKKAAKPKKSADSKPAVAPSSTPASNPPAKPNGEDRR